MNLHDLDRKALLTVEETAELLGVSRWVVYRSVQAGELPSIRLGRIYVPVPKLRALLGADESEDEQESPRALAVVAGKRRETA